VTPGSASWPLMNQQSEREATISETSTTKDLGQVIQVR
jgi:hypothetical protein